MTLHDQLPSVFFRAVPELLEHTFPSEKAANCANCSMKPSPLGTPCNSRAFESPARCCTYKPWLPNFLVGRVLLRNDEGSRRMEWKIASRVGMNVFGVGPSESDQKEYERVADREFGTTKTYVCPFWTGETYSCSIWKDRNAVCRTWHCKHDQGARSHRSWNVLKTLLSQLERGFAQVCVSDGTPPNLDAPWAEWVSWYRWCADHLENLPAARAEQLRTDGMRTVLSQVSDAIAERDRSMPDILIPSLVSWPFNGDSVSLNAYSGFDVLEFPRWVFTLFSKMDGDRPWREALSLAERDAGVPIGEELVCALYRQGSLSGVDGLRYDPGANMVVRMVNGEAIEPVVVRI